MERFKNGEYLVISNQNQDDEVILNPETKFNPQTLQAIQKSKLFTGISNASQTLQGKDIQVVKSAKVRRSGDYWSLIESGELRI